MIMNDNKKIIDEIIKYYMNPKKYPNQEREIVEDSIFLINNELNNKDKSCGLLEELFSKYTSTDINSPIVSTIYKTRADEQGISATREYKEIYFNEIIQNANDNTCDNILNIFMNKNDGQSQYEMVFEYADEGFTVENIIGFMNTEIHTKKNNLSATGKHGVGIKSLFYFVDYLKIESNIIIEFDIRTKIEDDIEKISSVSTKIEKNLDRSDCRKTKLFIRFPKKENYGEYNVKKLIDFIDFCCDEKNCSNYLFEKNQGNLVFDVRGLLFTDKNKNKKNGIKTINFYDNHKKESELFTVSVEIANEEYLNNHRITKEIIKFNEENRFSYLVFTLEGDDNEQNFSAAYPVVEELDYSECRYYETYYIPKANEEGINVLINSSYSNVSRTKLTDDDNLLKEIKEKINGKLLFIYRFMATKEISRSSLGYEISQLFHKLLYLDQKFVELCFLNNINNRFLKKSQDEIDEREKYLVYKRDKKENYEKKFIGQKIEKEAFIKFINEHVLQDDTREYHREKFDNVIADIYESAFDKSNNQKYKLRTILNIAGNIRDLIYYRVKGFFPEDDLAKLSDGDVDNWNKEIWNNDNNNDKIVISLSILGRYKLHEYLSNTGEIRGASFYEYIFSRDEVQNSDSVPYQTMKSKQQELYRNQYATVKNRLQELLINREQEGEVSLYGCKKRYERGIVAFYASWDTRAKCDTYYDSDNVTVYDYKNASDTDSFGPENTEIFIKKIVEEKEILKHCISINNKLMIASKEYPNWGVPTSIYSRPQLMATGRWFTCSLININFLRRIYAHTWEQFNFFHNKFLEVLSKETDNIEKTDTGNIVYKHGGFELFTYKRNDKALFSIDINNLSEIMRFFYTNNRFEKNKYYSIHFFVDLKGDVSNNLCPRDYFEFIYEQTGKKIYVMQTNAVNRQRKEILYCYNNNFKLFNSNHWVVIGRGKQNSSDSVYIVHTERIDYKEAIDKVLTDIFERNIDIIEKCKAFIPSNQQADIDSVSYNDITGRELDVNPEFRQNVKIDNAKNLSCDVLKRAIISRGNNNGKCCCCSKQNNNGILITTENKNDSTKDEYPQIFEVVCDRCEKLLRSSHKKTELIKNDRGYVIEYCCLIQNAAQKKEVYIRTKIYDGILEIIKKNGN